MRTPRRSQRKHQAIGCLGPHSHCYATARLGNGIGAVLRPRRISRIETLCHRMLARPTYKTGMQCLARGAVTSHHMRLHLVPYILSCKPRSRLPGLITSGARKVHTGVTAQQKIFTLQERLLGWLPRSAPATFGVEIWGRRRLHTTPSPDYTIRQPP